MSLVTSAVLVLIAYLEFSMRDTYLAWILHPGFLVDAFISSDGSVHSGPGGSIPIVFGASAVAWFLILFAVVLAYRSLVKHFAR